MATVKEVIDAFCYRLLLPAPGAYVGQTAPAPAQYLSLFEQIGDNLRSRPYNWPQLKRSYTFTTQMGVRRYQLPGDFYKLLESTQWDLTNLWPMRGPASDFNMALRKYAVVSLQTRKAYRIIGPNQYLYATGKRSAGSFEIDPAGGNDTDQLYMEYISSSWIWPRDWVTGTAYTAGDLRSGIGQIYKARNSATSGANRPDGTDAFSDGAVTWDISTEPYVATNDGDLCLYDKDLMVEGMRWAYLQAKGLEYQQPRQDWENQVRNAFSRFNGATRINMSDELGEQMGFPNIPSGNWDV